MYRAFEVLLEGALDAAIERGHLTAGDRAPCRLEVPVDQAFGDATSRVALAIARRTGRAPEPVARVLVQHLHDPDGWLELAEAAGPGFVNVRASLAYWRAALATCLAGPVTRSDLGRAAVAVPAGAPARARLVAGAVARLLSAAGHEVATIEGGADDLAPIADAPAVRRVVLVSPEAPATVHRAKAAFARAGGRAGDVAALGVGPTVVRHRGRPLSPDDAEATLAGNAARFALLGVPAAEPVVLDVERLASDRVDNPWVVVRYALARVARVGGGDEAVALDRLGEAERACLREIGTQADARDLAARRLEPEAMVAHATRLAAAFHRYYNRGAYAGRDGDPARRALARGVARALGATLDVVVPGGAGSSGG
jgi:arginyl-tRNA synthetase